MRCRSCATIEDLCFDLGCVACGLRLLFLLFSAFFWLLFPLLVPRCPTVRFAFSVSHSVLGFCRACAWAVGDLRRYQSAFMSQKLKERLGR